MKRFLLLALPAGLLSPIAAQAETIYLVLGTYKQHTGRKEPRLDTQTGSPIIQIIPMESLAQCNAAGEDLMENIYKPINFFAGGYRNIEASRKRLEENYQARVKVLENRDIELQEEIKALAPVKKEKVTA